MYEWEKNMKVVVLSGSPRKNGNTQIMMKHVLEYVNQKDVEVKFINLAEDGFESFKGAANEVNYKEKTLETTTGNYLINRQIPDSNSTGNLAIE